MKKYIKRKYNSLKYNFEFLGVYFSPLKKPKLRFYFGDIRIGTPYFLPRKWIKNKEKTGWLKGVPRKFGFDFVTLGWKTKYDEFRHEWNPILSFVFFGKQIAVWLTTKDNEFEMQFWEAWLYYSKRTKGSRTERIKELIEQYPCVWIRNGEVKTNYYYDILKTKYHKYLTTPHKEFVKDDPK